MHRSLAARIASVLGALVCCAAPARAHAPAEITQVAAYGERGVVLATNRGLILGQLSPRAFSLLCIESLPIGVDGSYRVVQLDTGRLLLGGTEGLLFSDNGGCSWLASESLANVAITNMVQHPTAPSTVFVSTGGTGQVALRVSTDGGQSFRTLAALSDTESIRSLLVSAGATLELSASGYSRTAGAPAQHFVLRSSDGGQSWTRLAVALVEGESELTLLAAHPALPGVLVARASALRPELGERALLSRDGGKSFELLATLRLMRSATISADTSEVYLAGVDGVLRVPVTPLASTTRVKLGESAWISHTQRIGQTVVACGYYDGIDAPHNGLAAVQAGGFEPWFSFGEVHDVVSCPEPSQVTAKCQAAIKDFRLENERFVLPTLPSLEAPDASVGEPSVNASDASAAPPLSSQGDGGRDASTQHPPDPPAAGTLADASASGTASPVDAAAAPVRPEGNPSARRRQEGCTLAGSQRVLGWPLLLLVLAVRARGTRYARQSAEARR